MSLSEFDFNNSHFSPNRYFDRHFECDAVKILPGEYFATKQNTLIVTVLGSCVSVCLRDPFAGVAGMNHFLLPGDSPEHSNLLSGSARYGVYAMEILVNHLLKLGARRNRLEAKVFGGGNVLKGFTTMNVGSRNADFVQEYLVTEKIPIIAKDLLGSLPRKIYFFANTGEVLVRKIKSLNNGTIIERESAYRHKLRSADNSGEVEIFDD